MAANYFEKLEENKRISESVIRSLETDNLERAKGFISTLLDFRGYKKLHDTYVKGVENALAYNNSDRIYVEYNIDGTVTGRLSNSGMGGRDGNKMGISFHTLPRESDINIREYVVAPPGHKFITADGKSMELRVLAHLAKEKRMAKAFHDKVDLHSYSASLTFNKSIDNVTKEERQLAKAVSFLTVYGGTYKTLARKQGISFKRAEKVINNWMDAFPGVPAYMQHVGNFITKNQYAYTIFGRRRNLVNAGSKVKHIREAAFRQGLNFTVQSSASDTIVCCILGLYEEMNKLGMRSKIIATVHDSVEIISPDDEVETMLLLLKKHFEEYPYIKDHFGINFSVPLELEIKVGDSFGTGEIVEV